MSQRKIGLRLDSLRGRPRQVIALAAELEMEGIEINCMKGEFTSAGLDRQARKEVVHFLEDLQLELVSLGADTGFRFEDESRIEEFVDKTREALDLALDLESHFITMAIGGLPEDKESERYELISKVMKELGDDAANRELAIALSAGMESPESLNDFLNELDNDGLKVNFDPANMVVFGHDPAEAVATLGTHIVSVRARDARKYLDGSAEELSLGEGDVPFDDVVDALDEIEYESFLLIARAPQEDQRGAIETARDFLRRYE
jgi:L-ribulose-5-phosphate 3-epimerase